MEWLTLTIRSLQTVDLFKLHLKISLLGAYMYCHLPPSNCKMQLSFELSNNN